jgi:peptidoglycan/xylan/chitin deacetylase (PgdA/CDA1 family)
MRVTSLLFHDVVPDGRWQSSGFLGADADAYKMDIVDFRRHLEAVARGLRRTVTTGTELLARPAVDHPLLFTFDDGGVSALDTADMLEEFGWKGHFFVTGGRIGTPGFLDRGQIQELHRRGHIIGSHSYTHPLRMALCSKEQLDDEWQRGGEVLSEILGEPIRVASVPGGFYSRAVASSAAEAGIRLLFNSEPVTQSQIVDGCLVLGRFNIMREYAPDRSAALVAGDRQLLMREYLFWNTKKLAKAVLGSLWLKARVLLMERRAKKEQ